MKFNEFYTYNKTQCPTYSDLFVATTYGGDLSAFMSKPNALITAWVVSSVRNGAIQISICCIDMVLTLSNFSPHTTNLSGDPNGICFSGNAIASLSGLIEINNKSYLMGYCLYTDDALDNKLTISLP